MRWADVTAPPSKKILRQFAALWLVFFVSLGVWRFMHQRDGFDLALMALGLVLGTIGLARPAAMRPIYTGWMIAAFPIGWTISQVMIAGLFYLVFTPIATLFRMMKRDPLHLRPGQVETYWTPKGETPDTRRYFRQF